MKISLFLYKDFSDFEIIQLLLLLRELPLTTYGFNEGLVKSIGNLKVHVDLPIEKLNTKDVDVFIIPGGEPKNFITDVEYASKIKILNKKLRELNKQEKLIAAICGGPTFLANAGLLNNIRSTASIAEDENKYY